MTILELYSYKAKMGDSNKQICRLCLEITPACECEIIEESNKEILKVLMINIDFDVTDNGVACSRCLESLQECFDFKSHCVNRFMDVDIKVDIKKEVFPTELTYHKSTCQENSNICQLCMSFIGNKALNSPTDLKGGVLLKDMIRRCLPDMDLHIVHEPLICKQCLSNVKKYYEFIKTCQEIEQRIGNYCQVVRDRGITGRIILDDLLKFKNCDTLSKPTGVKTECSDVENNVNIMMYAKNEPTSSIKSEEVDIKEGLDTGAESSESDQSGDCNDSGKNGSLETKIRTKTSASQGKNYFCPKCPYSARGKFHITRHMRNNKVRRCYLCPFITDVECLMVVHMKSHRGPTMAFGCRECPYETDNKLDLLRHMIKHKDTSQVQMHKCPLCLFESKYKSATVVHQRMQHNTNIKKYNCKECSFSTKHKVSFKGHQLMHKNPEEIPMYKCEKCMYKTKYKSALSRHMVSHEEPEAANKFKCDKCPYRTKNHCDLKTHMVIHSDKRPFSCIHCGCSFKRRGHLTRHIRTHQKDRELDHSKQPTFKCEQCKFGTRQIQYLIKHQAKHTKSEERLPNM